MKHRWKIIASVGGVIILATLSYLYSNASRFSLDDRDKFQNRPIVVKANGRAFLEWAYGDDGFAFIPRLKIRNDLAVFFLSGTSSSGDLSGQTVRREITGGRAIAAIQRGGVFWEEPGGDLIKLEIYKRGTRPLDVENPDGFEDIRLDHSSGSSQIK